jgi:protein-disulfide isomerase
MLSSVDRNRIYLLGAAGLGAVIVAVVLIIVGTGGSSGKTTTNDGALVLPTPSLAGIPQHGDTLGRPSAPVTIQVFEDPQCPYCREWNVDTLPSVLATYIKTGRVKLQYRGIEIISANSVDGLRAIYAAAQQNKLWQMVDAIYARQGQENSGWITPDLISTAARAAGADPAKVASAASSAAVDAMLKDSVAAAKAAAIGGTPTFVVQRPPGLPTQLQLAGLDPASFAAALDPVLK